MQQKERKIADKVLRPLMLFVVIDCGIIGLIGIVGLLAEYRMMRSGWNTGLFIFLQILLIVAVILITVVVDFRIGKRVLAREVTAPIGKITAAADRIAAGDLDVRLDINASDETGDLARSFEKTVASVKAMERDVGMLVSAAAEGDLDKRADVSLHGGEFRAIIEGANNMVDAIQKPLDDASAFIDNLADGAHQEDMENPYSGRYAALIGNLNRVRHSLRFLADETERLATAGLSGNLDVRGDEAHLNGIYADIIRGVNRTFDTMKSPLVAATEFVKVLAVGGELEPMENTYQGYYSELIGSLNQVLASLQVLTAETLKLVDAGKKGEMNVRGDSEKVPGHFAEMIVGINGILDAVTAPLREAGGVLKKLSLNDLSAGMSDGYNGVYSDLTDSINGVRERLLSVERLVGEVTAGSTAMLAELRQIGKRSENDHLMPGFISMMETIRSLIEQTDRLAGAAVDGDLHVRGDEKRFEGGYRQIILGMNQTMEAMAAPIHESSEVLRQAADGNLTIKMTGDYRGTYHEMKNSINHTIDAFNFLLGKIRIAAKQVAAGAAQVSDASQALSGGATEQASSVEELTSSMAEVAAETRQNALDAKQASTHAKAASEKVTEGSAQMERLLESMRRINEASTGISKIIKVIDDIAFQTNILALNAAVEAARAGQYGKGFAVVAEEVRSLASKSAQAAKETAELIEDSIGKAETGTGIADATAETLRQISGSVQKVSELFRHISEASSEQATAITQIDQGIAQVSSVVQTNSATSEESAAASEELSSQAEMLLQTIGQFKLADFKETTDY